MQQSAGVSLLAMPGVDASICRCLCASWLKARAMPSLPDFPGSFAGSLGVGLSQVRNLLAPHVELFRTVSALD